MLMYVTGNCQLALIEFFSVTGNVPQDTWFGSRAKWGFDVVAQYVKLFSIMVDIELQSFDQLKGFVNFWMGLLFKLAIPFK